jgi:hypothetical protein
MHGAAAGRFAVNFEAATAAIENAAAEWAMEYRSRHR